MSQKETLVAILAALPCEKPGIGTAELDQIAADIVLVAKFGGHNELPRARQVNPKKAATELYKYGQLCHKLGCHIQSMSRTSLGMIEENLGDAPHPLQLFGKLSDAIESGRRAFEYTSSPLPIDLVKGAPRKDRAKQTTLHAAKVYQNITGKSPTRVTVDGVAGGPFLEFLSKIFETLEIKASAESQTKAMEKSSAQKD